MVVGHQPQQRRERATIHTRAHVHIRVHVPRIQVEEEGRGRSFSELGWPPPVQLANSRTRRVNCTTTYISRRRRNAATMMPSSHEITRDMPRHDIPLAGSPACPREESRLILDLRARITSFIHLCRPSTEPAVVLLPTRADLLFTCKSRSFADRRFAESDRGRASRITSESLEPQLFPLWIDPLAFTWWLDIFADRYIFTRL